MATPQKMANGDASSHSKNHNHSKNSNKNNSISNSGNHSNNTSINGHANNSSSNNNKHNNNKNNNNNNNSNDKNGNGINYYNYDIENMSSNEIRTALDELFKKLLSNNCLVDVREGLQTFLIYVSNIIKHPSEAKYRKIRIGNVNYRVRLGHLEGGQDLLVFLGYRDDGKGFLVLPLNVHRKSDNGLSKIKEVRDIACAKLENVTKIFKDVPRLEHSHKWNSVVHAAEAHSIGRRTSMEDDHLLIDCFGNSQDTSFFALYDGHGGRSSVDFLTCSLYLNLEFYLLKNSHIAMKKVFEDVYELTDKQIHRQQIYQSGSTSVTCLIRNEGKKRMLHISNCGDTRGVLCRNGKAIRLTKDHKADDPDEEAMIKRRGGVIGRMKRVNGLLAVTRAFGDHLLKPPISVKPHCRSIELTDKDEFLVIACDGVWDVMKDEEVIAYVYQSVTRKAKKKSWKMVDPSTLRHVLHNVCLEIIKLSIDRRSQDNVSVIIAAL